MRVASLSEPGATTDFLPNCVDADTCIRYRKNIGMRNTAQAAQPRLSPKSAALAAAGYAAVPVHPVLAARAAANQQYATRQVRAGAAR